MAAQHEQMKEVVAALQDSERGKPGSLASLLAQHAERHASKILPHEKSEVVYISHCSVPKKHMGVLRGLYSDQWAELEQKLDWKKCTPCLWTPHLHARAYEVHAGCRWLN